MLIAEHQAYATDLQKVQSLDTEKQLAELKALNWGLCEIFFSAYLRRCM
jgi:hypothetical protein